VILIDSERTQVGATQVRRPRGESIRVDARGALHAHWEGHHGSLSISSEPEDGDVRRYDLTDGTALIIGKIHELVERFSPNMKDTLPIDALGSEMTCDRAVRLLSSANGLFIAFVIHDTTHDRGTPSFVSPVTTIVQSWTPARLLYYGRSNERVVASTSPQTVSDLLDLGREVNTERLFEICLHRHLVDEQTLFRGVFRLHNDERLVVSPGRTDIERLDRSSCVMSGLSPGRSADPYCLEVGRRLVRRAVEIRCREAGNDGITLLLSSGLDSRALMAIARLEGVPNVVGVSMGTHIGHDESRVAAEFSREMGYQCLRFFEDELDFRGLLEPYLRNCAYPPKFYNHLPLEAALRRAGRRGGQLWTGDLGTIDGTGSVFGTVALQRSLRPWIPAPALFRLLMPLHERLPESARDRLRLLALTREESAAVNLSAEPSLAEGRAALAVFGRRANLFDPAPQCTPGLMSTIQRLGRPLDWAEWRWLWSDIIFQSNLRSRLLLADSIGARLDVPLRDISLLAFGAALYPSLGPEFRYKEYWKEMAYEAWLPDVHGARKRGLVGRLPEWFRDSRKLGDYVDVVRSRACIERGIFDRKIVGRIVDRLDRLTQHEARLLWTVLTTELLFQDGTLAARRSVDKRAPIPRDRSA